MYNYKLLVSYDGTNYSGWQVQPNGISIQHLLQKAILTITKEDVIVVGSGRTDAGVHALGQTANFKCSKELDLHSTLRSLNGLIPHDVRIRNIEVVDQDFNARFSAKSKTYHYHLHLGATENPFKRLYSWHLYHKIDIDALKEAAEALVGTFDFTSFSNQSDRGSAGINPVRTIFNIDVVEEDEGICLAYSANGYLYKMVRNITGTLVEVGSGKRSPPDMQKLLNAKDRRLAAAAAPPRGLFLMHVDY
jgi:tRNA pseudouridine38-40 synthase